MQCYGQSFIQLSNLTPLPKCQRTLVLRVVCVNIGAAFVSLSLATLCASLTQMVFFVFLEHVIFGAKHGAWIWLCCWLHHCIMKTCEPEWKQKPEKVLSRGQKSKIRHCFLSITLDQRQYVSPVSPLSSMDSCPPTSVARFMMTLVFPEAECVAGKSMPLWCVASSRTAGCILKAKIHLGTRLLTRLVSTATHGTYWEITAIICNLLSQCHWKNVERWDQVRPGETR